MASVRGFRLRDRVALVVAVVGAAQLAIVGRLLGFGPWLLAAAIALASVTLLSGWLAGRALSPLAVFAGRLRAMADERDWERSLRAPALVAAEGGIAELEALRQRILARIEASQRVRRQAEEASAYKTEFLRSVRHELRTPLNSILGFSDVLLGSLEGPLTESQRENLQTIRDSGQRLSDLFDEVIDLATMASGEGELEQVELDVGELVEEAAEALEQARGSRPVHIRRELADDLPPVCGDRARLRRMLMGLSSHALEITTGVELVLSASASARGVRIEVRDPSRKLSAEELVALQSSGDAPSKRKGLDRGSRLRLHLCRQLAELHEGSLEVLSTETAGTTFATELPMRRRA
jgi:two-component system cell cycle sensor histidine kinase PleC